MFWKRKRTDGGPVANRLHDEARPNELWNGSLSDGPDDDRDLADDRDLDEEPDDDDTIDAAYEDEVPDDDEREAAARADELQAELQREAEEYGLTEFDAQSLFGPNGEAVSALLEGLPECSTEDLEGLLDEREAVPKAELSLARSAVRRARDDADTREWIQAAQDGVSGWLAKAFDALPDPEGDEADLLAQAGRALADAVTALVLADDLDDADFEALGGPWAEAFGRSFRETEARRAEEGAKEAGSRAGGPPSSGSWPPVDGGTDVAGEAPEEGGAGEYGPNTASVMDLLRHLSGLDDDAIARLGAAWEGLPARDLDRAHKAVRSLAAEDPEWRDQVRAAQHNVIAWTNATRQPRLRGVAAPAVADAIAAIVMADLLEPDDAALLYSPWATVVGGPALPVPAE